MDKATDLYVWLVDVGWVSELCLFPSDVRKYDVLFE